MKLYTIIIGDQNSAHVSVHLPAQMIAGFMAGIVADMSQQLEEGHTHESGREPLDPGADSGPAGEQVSGEPGPVRDTDRRDPAAEGDGGADEPEPDQPVGERPGGAGDVESVGVGGSRAAMALLDELLREGPPDIIPRLMTWARESKVE